jgi:hypothetical protein
LTVQRWHGYKGNSRYVDLDIIICLFEAIIPDQSVIYTIGPRGKEKEGS